MKKRILSSLLALLMVVSLLPMQVFAAEGEVTRIQWLQKLTETFDMTVEADNYPDNYYSDVSSSDSYYKDVMIATEFGLIDQEPGTELKPNEPATREFAAHTLNFCLGYELDEGATYTFTDSASLTYADDAQIAVNRGWFALVGGKFMPEQSVTNGEMTAMLADAAAVLEGQKVDTGAQSEYTFADGVKEIPESASVTTSEDGSSLTIEGYTGTLKAGDIIAVHEVFPVIYSVTAVKSADGVLTLTVTKLDADDYILSMNTQGSVDADLSEVEAAEDTDITYIFNNGVETQSAARAQALLKNKNIKIKDVKLDRTLYNSGGVKVSVYGKLSKMKLEYNIDLGLFNNYAMVKVDGKASVGCSASFNASASLGLPSSITLAYVPVAGIGKIEVVAKVSLEGEVSLEYNTNFTAGFEYSSSGGFRAIKNFSTGSFSVQAQVNIKAGIEAKAGLVDIPFVSGSVYFEAGAKMKMYYSSVNSDTVKYCIDTSAFLYAAAGYNIGIKNVKTWSDTYEIWNMSNSPIKVHNHFENGVSTGGVCTVGSDCYNMGYGKFGYTTGADSRYYNFGGSNGSSKGTNAAGEPYTIFEYSLDDDKNATITKYYGNVSALFVPKTIDGYTVIAIGSDAFKGRAELRSVVIPSSITTIGSSAFNGCSNLSNITFNDGLTTIGEYAFTNCTSLTSVTIPDTVVKMEAGVFASCSNLSSVKLSKKLEQMDGRCFFDCDKLTAIEIPKSLVKSDTAYWNFGREYGPFYDCDGLKTVTFEEGTTVIPTGLFANCPGLESIEIPDTITAIENSAFANDKNLSSVKLSESLTLIKEYAFTNCTSLTSITIPDSVVKMEPGVFASCSNLSSVKLSKNLEQMDGRCFFDCDKLTAIEIPKSLVKSGTAYWNFGREYGPFYDCDGLKTVTFEEGTTLIPTGLFANCPGLESIEIPNTITRIGQEAFLRCKNLKTVELKDGLQQIDKGAFNSCTSLTEISIPDTVSLMGTYVFESCSSLKTAKLPSIRERIMAYTFENCTSLEKIVLPDTVTEIQDHAFKNCTSLKDITWSKSLNTIKEYAFENCDALTEVKLPNSVTYIGAGVFYDCDGLTSVSIPDSVTSVGVKLFYDCDALTDVKLGTGITTIPENTFNHCDVLASIVIPRRVTTIGNYAFKDCVKFTEITIPRAVTSISANAFSYPAKMTIYGVAGTYAETFANDNSIKFVDKQINATTAALDKTTLTLNKGSSAKLYLTVQPDDFTDEVNWKSADTSIATVAEDGTVKAVGVGTTTIKVTVGNASASCKVTVVQPVTSISLNRTSLSMEALSTYQLTATAYPNDAYDKSIRWESSDTSVATVSEDGLVTAVGKGTATIKAISTAVSSVYRSCTVTVTNNGTVAKDVAQLESPHNYSNNCSDIWLYTLTGAPAITVTFDERTNIEDGFDYLYIYDANDKQVGKYTGTELAGKSITIDGDTVKIKLISDGGGNEWGFKVTGVVASAAHVHSYTATATAPTCTKDGYTTYTCSCGDTYVSNYTDALGHSYGAWFVTDEPTCDENGWEARTCIRCDDTQTRYVEALGHDIVHHDGKAATCTKSGCEEYDTCSRCDYTTYEKIDALGHSYKNGKCTRCGTKDPNYIAAPVLKITTSAGKPKLSWNKVDGAAKYVIFRGTEEGLYKEYVTVTATSYTDKNTKIGTRYYYIVMAVRADGAESAFSNDRNIKCVPAAPTVTISRSGGKAKLSWKKVSGATKYWIYRSTDGKNYGKPIATTKLTYTDSKSKSGTKYYYKVRAIAVVNNTNVGSAFSTAKSITTTLAKPTVKITTSNGKPKLTWSKVTGADKYYIYRSTDGKTFKYYTSTTKLTYTNTGAKKNTKYYYKVKSICSSSTAANSAYSTVVSIKATK